MSVTIFTRAAKGSDLTPTEADASLINLKAAVDAAFALSGSSYVIPTLTSVATTNGTNLIAAYAAAKILTPSGAALSATNRAVVLVMPGKYDLGSSTLTMDTQFVDLIGISGEPADVFITSSTGTLAQTANNSTCKNFTLSTTFVSATGVAPTNATKSAYFPNSNLTGIILDNVTFSVSGGAIPTRLNINYKGIYRNIISNTTGTDDNFTFSCCNGTGVTSQNLSGVFENIQCITVSGNNYSFNSDFGNAIWGSTLHNGVPTISGTLRNITVGVGLSTAKNMCFGYDMLSWTAPSSGEPQLDKILIYGGVIRAFEAQGQGTSGATWSGYFKNVTIIGDTSAWNVQTFGATGYVFDYSSFTATNTNGVALVNFATGSKLRSCEFISASGATNCVTGAGTYYFSQCRFNKTASLGASVVNGITTPSNVSDANL